MPKTDPRIDAYIEKSGDFAKPILAHLRKVVHDAAPDIEETLKWSMPSFTQDGIVCGFASFKEHCTFGFWKQSLLEQTAFPEEKTAMGSFGRLESLNDLPSDEILTKLIKDAVQLNLDGIKVKKTVSKDKQELVVPDILLEALARNDAAAATFDKFPYSKKKDYVQWITEARADATREKRLATTIEWLAEGKSRNWKYENC